MKIENHKLVGSGSQKVDYEPSDKTSGKFKSKLPDTIVIHYTAGRSAASSVKTLINPSIKASAHLVIGRDNSITQLVPFDTVAWHAGKSTWQNRQGLNKFSIGIEIDNAGRLEESEGEYLSWFKKSYPKNEVYKGVHRNESEAVFWHRYTPDQIELTQSVCELLIEAYGIKLILGHEEISPGRKSDPGPAFPLDKLRNDLLYSDRQSENPDEFDASHGAVIGLGVVTANKLNVRSQPDLNGAKISDPLKKGTNVEILEKKGNWYRVHFKKSGWVSSDWINKTK